MLIAATPYADIYLISADIFMLMLFSRLRSIFSYVSRCRRLLARVSRYMIAFAARMLPPLFWLAPMLHNKAMGKCGAVTLFRLFR